MNNSSLIKSHIAEFDLNFENDGIWKNIVDSDVMELKNKIKSSKENSEPYNYYDEFLIKSYEHLGKHTQKLFNLEILDKLKTQLKVIIDYSINTQIWIGYIEELYDDSFTAKLYDKDDLTTYELAEFSIHEDVSDGDKDLLKIGAIFYWSLVSANKNGQVKKESFIRFKRSIPVQVREFDSVLDQADKLNDNIIWE